MWFRMAAELAFRGTGESLGPSQVLAPLSFSIGCVPVRFGQSTRVIVRSVLGAVVVAIGHHKDFLLMVGFFSYYMTVRGYRILFLKSPCNIQP